MKLPKLIAYYTEGDKNNFYVKCAANLEAQCKKFGFDYYFEKKSSLKDYTKNCKLKPKFILDCLSKFNEPLLFLDIDADLTGLIPPEFETLINYDIGITRTWHDPNPNEELELKSFVNAKSMNGNFLMIRDGFLFVNNTDRGKQFVNDWEYGCKSFNHTDHLILDHYIKEHIKFNKTKIKILSGVVNCCPTIDTINALELRHDKTQLLENKKVFCFYGVSGSR